MARVSKFGGVVGGTNGGYVENSPSKVIDPNADDSMSASISPNIKFDPKQGWIVQDEDPAVINGLNIPEEEKKRLLERRARHIKEAEVAAVEEKKKATMTTVERIVEDRFTDI